MCRSFWAISRPFSCSVLYPKAVARWGSLDNAPYGHRCVLCVGSDGLRVSIPRLLLPPGIAGWCRSWHYLLLRRPERQQRRKPRRGGDGPGPPPAAVRHLQAPRYDRGGGSPNSSDGLPSPKLDGKRRRLGPRKTHRKILPVHTAFVFRWGLPAWQVFNGGGVNNFLLKTR